MHHSKSSERTRGSSALINDLAQIVGAQRYLEIGVAKGKTFCDVAVAYKVAVDPRFQFDTKTRPKNEHFHETESNTWFSTRDGTDEFDLIFLDGLHNFDQSFRDFCNTLLMAHGKTVWLIDDTVPSDIYSAWPNQTEAVGLRRAEIGHLLEGARSGAWNGDVYKVVFAIHDFFPMLSYRTTLNARKPQTIVWQQARSNFKPFFCSIESISRSTYFDFRKNVEILRPASEEAILLEMSAHFRKPSSPSPVIERAAVHDARKFVALSDTN